MAIAAHWTVDCMGKLDFDGPILIIRSRYWPRGGSHLEINTFSPDLMRDGSHPSRQDIKPSAHSEIIIRDREEDHDQTIVEEDFEAETEVEVKNQLEAWANEQRDRIIRAIVREFG